MQALKALVIGMAVLIVLGVGLLIYGLSTKMGSIGDEGGAETAKPAAGEGQAVPAAFGEIRAALPAGATVGDMAVEAGRIVVPVQLPDGSVRIIVFSLATGARLGTIDLETSP